MASLAGAPDAVAAIVGAGTDGTGAAGRDTG